MQRLHSLTETTHDPCNALGYQVTFDPVHATFWAVCLTGFFGLLCKSDMLLKGVAKFNLLKYLRQSDIVFYPGWAVVNQPLL